VSLELERYLRINKEKHTKKIRLSNLKTAHIILISKKTIKKEIIKKMYINGLKRSDICYYIGITDRTLRKYLKEMKIPLRNICKKCGKRLIKTQFGLACSKCNYIYKGVFE